MNHWSEPLSVRAKNVLICLTWQYGHEKIMALTKDEFRQIFIEGQNKGEIKKDLSRVKNCGKVTTKEIKTFLNI